MKFLTFELANTIRWRVGPDAPAVLPAECFDGWFPVNPLIYPWVLPMTVGRPDVYHVQGLVEGDALVRTCFLALAQEDSCSTPPPTFEQALDLLARWRHVSRQALMGTSLLSIASRAGPFELGHVPPVHFPEERHCRPASITRKAVDGALTPEHLRHAADLPHDFVVPIHDAMLLDAICAWLNADYRKAILYAAIAVESLANVKLEEALTTAIASTGPQFRIVSVPAKGTPCTKDPVYEALAQGTNFARLIHERSLYLLNRSLLVDDPQLYALALRLYSTRNKIAHRGEPSAEQSAVLPLNVAGGLQALDCAIRVFRWYGEGVGYCLPDQGHVHALAVMRQVETSACDLRDEVYLGTAIINTATIEVMAALTPSEVSEMEARRGGETSPLGDGHSPRDD